MTAAELSWRPTINGFEIVADGLVARVFRGEPVAPKNVPRWTWSFSYKSPTTGRWVDPGGYGLCQSEEEAKQAARDRIVDVLGVDL